MKWIFTAFCRNFMSLTYNHIVFSFGALVVNCYAASFVFFFILHALIDHRVSGEAFGWQIPLELKMVGKFLILFIIRYSPKVCSYNHHDLSQQLGSMGWVPFYEFLLLQCYSRFHKTLCSNPIHLNSGFSLLFYETFLS